MEKIIQNKLSEIEKEHNIKILFSCESGSRAWGFPSPDSDYDVRFIYMRTPNEYLSLKSIDDHLSFPINDELDIYGWDLRKTLRLVVGSNTTPFEWLQSPVIYREEKDFREDLWKICEHYFYRRKNIRHYLGIAKGALETVNETNEIKIKKLFYILRPLLAAKWCMERNTIAPMNIKPLMEVAPSAISTEITALIKRKENADEGFLISMSSTLKSWIEDTLKECMSFSDGLESCEFDTELLDNFFFKTIGYDYKGA